MKIEKRQHQWSANADSPGRSELGDPLKGWLTAFSALLSTVLFTRGRTPPRIIGFSTTFPSWMTASRRIFSPTQRSDSPSNEHHKSISAGGHYSLDQRCARILLRVKSSPPKIGQATRSPTSLRPVKAHVIGTDLQQSHWRHLCQALSTSSSFDPGTRYDPASSLCCHFFLSSNLVSTLAMYLVFFFCCNCK